MKFLSLAVLFLTINAQARLPYNDKYYGKKSTEALLTFSTVAEIPHTGELTLATLKKPGRIQDNILAKLDMQVQHLMGTFQSESFQEDFGYPGVIGETYEIEFKEVKVLNSKTKLIKYAFKGKVVFHTSAFKAPTINVPIKLPLAYDKIYDLGLEGDENVCTDEHYNSEDDFWYFWDPDMEGCPLKDDKVNVLRITGKLKRLDNTELTYPEYDKLYADNGNGETLETGVFLGYIEDIDDLTTVNTKDDAYIAMKEIEADLKLQDFELKEKKDHFREYLDGRVVKGINFYRVYEKAVKTATGKNIISRVKILLSDTSVTSADETFHRHFAEGLADNDILVYDGHSGLGANLSLDNLPTVPFKAKKYQIYYFNGCSSYPYYNGMFFDAKGGTKNLDILTSGLPTFTTTAGDNMKAFLAGFVNGKVQSYQKLLGVLEASNGDYGTYLTGVNGDEDNTFTPAR